MNACKWILLVLFSASVISFPLYAELKFQGGAESYFGPNRLFSLTPWVGIRSSLGSQSSLLFKLFQHNISYEYQNDLGELRERDAHLLRMTLAVFAQKWQHSFYAAYSVVFGTDRYSAMSVSAGSEFKINPRINGLLELSYMNENSILWFPGEPPRQLEIYSIGGGLRYKFLNTVAIGPTFSYNLLSESATSYSIGLSAQMAIFHSVFLLLKVYHYSESAKYMFSGNFISASINFYL